MEKNTVLNDFLSSIAGWAVSVGLKLLVSAIILLVSFRIINKISQRIERTGDSGRLDKTIARALAYVFRLGIKSIVIVCLVGFVGIDTSGFVGLFVSVGAGIGLALNGALSNLAGGILIIATRPFRVDDFIEAQGYSGTVEDIHITMTKIRTPDNKVVYIPNGPLSSGTVVNYSVKDTRRVDFTFSIGYGVNFEKAKTIVLKICEAHELVLSDPAPMVRVSNHGASGLTLVCRVWTKREDYWTVNFDLLEAVKAEFDKEGIEIPFNQLDVHIKKES